MTPTPSKHRQLVKPLLVIAVGILALIQGASAVALILLVTGALSLIWGTDEPTEWQDAQQTTHIKHTHDERCDTYNDKAA